MKNVNEDFLSRNKTVLEYATFIVGMLLLLTACGGSGATYSLIPQATRFHQQGTAFNNKLDILFVIDDQPSMSSFQAKLTQSMSSFMSQFQTKGYDFKIAVATTSAYMADSTLNGYVSTSYNLADFNDYNGTVHSGLPVLLPTDANLFGDFTINAQPNKNSAGQDARAFSSFRAALNSTRPINAGFLRPDSYLAIIIVDDQDDFSGNARCVGCNTSGRYTASTLDPTSVYTGYLNSLTGTSGAKARYNVSAMTQIAKPCQGSSTMTRIMDIANQTNGVLGDICQADFGASMTSISNQIATLSTQFFLPTQPVAASINVFVDGVSVVNSATNGWTYDSTANSIVFHGSAIPQQGAIVDVKYDPVSAL